MPFTKPSPASSDAPEPREPVSTLRGAGATVDARAVGRVLLGIVMLTLAVLVVVFVIVGAHKNAQIDELKTHGIPVPFTVDKCIGLLGGSGSNGAGYACTGTYELGGHRYHQALPGNGYYAPGSMVRAIAVSSDPTLVSTAQIVRSDHTSVRVYILPAVLFAVLVGIVALIVLRRRRPRRGQAGGV